MGPKCNYKFPCRKEAEKIWQGGKQGDTDERWQGADFAEEGRNHEPRNAGLKAGKAETQVIATVRSTTSLRLWFDPVKLILDFWFPELEENKMCVFLFMVIFH